MSERQCRSCLHYGAGSATLGPCRRYPPQLETKPRNGFVSSFNATFPTVSDGWTCGEWTARKDPTP